MATKLVPIREHEWSDDLSFMRTLTCINHPTAKYLTKNPFIRSIHLLRLPTDTDIPRSPNGECVCPLTDLAVVVTVED